MLQDYKALFKKPFISILDSAQKYKVFFSYSYRLVTASASPNETAALTSPTDQTYQMVVEVAASVPEQIQSNFDNGTIVTNSNRSSERSFQVNRITVYREDIQPVCSAGEVRRGEGEGAKCGMY